MSLQDPTATIETRRGEGWRYAASRFYFVTLLASTSKVQGPQTIENDRMGKWKDAFLRSLNPSFETPESFEFGPQATEAELSALSSAVSATLPKDLSELLREFNGVMKVREAEREPYFFDTKMMPTAGDYYRDWDCDTKLAMELFKKVLWVCQENGFSEMWAVVVKPFAIYKFGDVVSFDHDRIMFAETETDLFTVNYENLEQLVEARFKESD